MFSQTFAQHICTIYMILRAFFFLPVIASLSSHMEFNSTRTNDSFFRVERFSPPLLHLDYRPVSRNTFVPRGEILFAKEFLEEIAHAREQRIQGS